MAKRVRSADIYRRMNPELPEFWNISMLAARGRAQGLKLTSVYAGVLISQGRGPRICATCGEFVLITPEDGQAWLDEKIAARQVLDRRDAYEGMAATLAAA